MITQKNALVRRIIEQLSPEERHLFSDSQIEALHRSALSLPTATHAVNLRWSVPFPGKGFYLVLFAGKERRSRHRLLADGDFQLMPRVILGLSTLLGCLIVFGLAYSQRVITVSKQHAISSLEEPTDTVHPTVVPFKYNQEECETSFREWKDGQCIDYDHGHTF